MDRLRADDKAMPDDTAAGLQAQADKPYHAKRPHRKSRAGCINCKQRRVKCSEDKPRCRACTLRKEDCRYPPAASADAAGHRRVTSTARSEDDDDSLPVRPQQQRPAAGALASPPESPAVSEMDSAGWEMLSWEPEQSPTPAPVFELMPPAAYASSVADMKLMWFYNIRAVGVGPKDDKSLCQFVGGPLIR